MVMNKLKVDYNETFALVAKMATVRIFQSIAVGKGLELHQMDVNNAFLREHLDEEPPEFRTSNLHKVCHLHKFLYGLKQPHISGLLSFLPSFGIWFYTVL